MFERNDERYPDESHQRNQRALIRLSRSLVIFSMCWTPRNERVDLYTKELTPPWRHDLSPAQMVCLVPQADSFAGQPDADPIGLKFPQSRSWRSATSLAVAYTAAPDPSRGPLRDQPALKSPDACWLLDAWWANGRRSPLLSLSLLRIIVEARDDAWDQRAPEWESL